MKNIQIFSGILFGVLASGVLASCTNSFEEWNKNPNEVTPDEMQQDNLLTGSNYSTMQQGVLNVNSKDGNGVFQRTEALNGGFFSGYMADVKGAYGGVSRHHDHYVNYDHWANAAFSFGNTQIMEPYRQICAVSDENSVDRAMATVLRVYGMHRVTDKYGPIIYSKFGTGVQVGYDSQKDVYTSFFNELAHAVEVLGTYVDQNPGKAYMARYDRVYQGDVARWVKFANTLRLRLAMRVSYVDQNLAKTQAQAALDEPHGLMTAATDDAILHQGNGLVFTNPYWEITQSWDDQRMGATMDCYMNGYNDPRIEKYFTKSAQGDYRGVRNGMTTIYLSTLKQKVSGYNFEQHGDMPWMRAAEAYFLQAEAKLRLGIGSGSVKDLYEQGVRCSFASYGVSDADGYLQSENLPLSTWMDPNTRTMNDNERSVSVSNMLSMVTPKFDETGSQEQQLEQIMVQKWIALFPDGTEAWSEMRRTGYPGWVRIETYSYTSEVADNDIIRRLHFPNSEYTDNGANVTEAVRMLGGGDLNGTHLWWDVK